VATADIDDLDEVEELIGHRLLEMQVDDGLPVYVMLLRPIERVVAQLRESAASKFPAPLPFA